MEKTRFEIKLTYREVVMKAMIRPLVNNRKTDLYEESNVQ